MKTLFGVEFSSPFSELNTTTRHFAPECSLGTTKEFFEEISNMKKLPERRELIEYYIEGINV